MQGVAKPSLSKVDLSRIGARLADYYRDPEAVIAVAVSGGADSLALLSLTLDWARDKGRPVHALIVDHGLRSASADEAEQTARIAQNLGAQARVLTWTPPKITSAVQARARVGRYGLLGRACRALGAKGLLVGHTQNDQAETIIMRELSGSGWRGLAGMAEKTRAPIWPQLRGVTLLRPMLDMRREQTRSLCAARSIAFIDDPSNEDTVFARVRVRASLAGNSAERERALALAARNGTRRHEEQRAARAWLSQYAKPTEAAFTIPKAALNIAGATCGLAEILKASGGAARRADMASVERLMAAMGGEAPAAATLGGAIIHGRKNAFLITRDPGGVLGRGGQGASTLMLAPSQPAIWDNRYQVSAPADGASLGPLWPSREQLDKAARTALSRFDPAVRRVLPGFYRGEVLIAVPALEFQTVTGEFQAIDLTAGRVFGADAEKLK